MQAPYWLSVPHTNMRKLDGASYDTAADAERAAEARHERPLVVYGTTDVFGYPVPTVLRVLEVE